jgi:hypothetical protein
MENNFNILQNVRKFDLEKLSKYLKTKPEYINIALQFDNDLTSKFKN